MIRRFIILIIMLCVVDCVHRKIDFQSEIEKNSKKFIELKARGDEEFEKMFWFGWNNAITHYKKALLLKTDQEIKQKLFFSYILKALRQKQLHIMNQETIHDAEKLLNELDGNIFRYYFFLTKNFIPNQFFKIPEVEVEPDVIKNRKKDYLQYLYSLLLKIKGPYKLYQNETELFKRIFPESNLRFYLNFDWKKIDIDTILKKWPDFFEVVLIKAEKVYSQGKITEAKKLYESVLKINPNVPDATAGIGKFYLGLGLYREALIHYENTLKVSPLYYKGLFGKAVCLNELNDYKGSIDALNIMIKNDVMHQGEAYYYLALNFFLMKKIKEVEPNIKSALTYIPFSLELNMLAGIYYYHQKKFEQSKEYLNMAKKIFPTYAESYFYLGLIHLEKQQISKVLESFKTAAILYKKLIMNKKEHIRGLLGSEKLPDTIKQKIIHLRIKRLKETIKESIQKLDIILKSFIYLKNAELSVIKKIKTELQSELDSFQVFCFSLSK